MNENLSRCYFFQAFRLYNQSYQELEKRPDKNFEPLKASLGALKLHGCMKLLSLGKYVVHKKGKIKFGYITHLQCGSIRLGIAIFN